MCKTAELRGPRPQCLSVPPLWCRLILSFWLLLSFVLILGGRPSPGGVRPRRKGQGVPAVVLTPFIPGRRPAAEQPALLAGASRTLTSSELSCGASQPPGRGGLVRLVGRWPWCGCRRAGAQLVSFRGVITAPPRPGPRGPSLCLCFCPGLT